MNLLIALKDEIFSMLYHLEQKSQYLRFHSPVGPKESDSSGL